MNASASIEPARRRSRLLFAAIASLTVASMLSGCIVAPAVPVGYVGVGGHWAWGPGHARIWVRG